MTAGPSANHGTNQESRAILLVVRDALTGVESREDNQPRTANHFPSPLHQPAAKLVSMLVSLDPVLLIQFLGTRESAVLTHTYTSRHASASSGPDDVLAAGER